MKRTIEYLKNFKEDVSHSIEDEHSTSVTVDTKDLKHINEALEDIEKLVEENKKLEELNRKLRLDTCPVCDVRADW